MSLSLGRLSARREELTRQIAQQRKDLAEAYRDLGRPLQYTQTGLKGLQMVRQNAWLIGLAPSLLGIVTGLAGLVKKKKQPPKWLHFWKRPEPAKEEEKEVSGLEKKFPPGARSFVRRLLRHGATAFKVYRRVRPYIPL